MADTTPHPSTHTKEEHHSWLREVVRDLQYAAAVGAIAAFAVSVGHSDEDARKTASNVMSALSAGGSLLAVFEHNFGHHFS